MAKEHQINGKRCRYYHDGKILVSDDGTLAVMPGTHEILPIKHSTDGTIYVDHKWGDSVFIANAVLTCFCPPKPKDGKKYKIRYKDGNPANCHYKNLEWEVIHYTHTTALEVDNDSYGEILTVHKDGTIWSKDGKQYTVHDDLYNSDTDLWVCVESYIKIPVGNNPYGKTVHVEELMREAGFVNGDDAVLKDPVILHRDLDRTNFSADNLEWVENTDQRYIDYQTKKKADKHQRDVKLNPGKTLLPGM
jgi:hypothetical protein